MILYALSRTAPDKILKGKQITEWKILSGMNIGRVTVLKGSHCLTDSKELVEGYLVSEFEKDWNLHTYELIEKKG